MKFIKIAVQDCSLTPQDLGQQFKQFLESQKYKFVLYSWDTADSDELYCINTTTAEPVDVKDDVMTNIDGSFTPCGCTSGKINGRILVCGKNDYLCPDCLQAQKMPKK